jgi:hypothetical protein
MTQTQLGHNLGAGEWNDSFKGDFLGYQDQHAYQRIST